MPEYVFKARGQAQHDYVLDLDPGHAIFRAGWGGGKTHCGGFKSCLRAIKNRGNGILMGQHFRHLRHVMVAKLHEVAGDMGLRPDWRATDKVFLFRALKRRNEWGCQFAHGLSADAPDAIRAVQGTWGWGDEPAAYSSSTTDAIRTSWPG